MAKASGKGGTIKLNMSNVESNGTKRYPEGDYHAKITGVKVVENQNTGNSQLKVDYQFIAPKTGTFVDYMALTEAALWRIGNLFDAIGIKWSKAKIEIPVNKLIGKELGLTLADDEYNGKIKSKTRDFLDKDTVLSALAGIDEDDDEDDENEDEEEADELDEDEDTDEEEDDGLSDLSRKELVKAAKDVGIKKTKGVEDDDLITQIRTARNEDDDDEVDELDVDDEL